jgi:hypothetical protein
VGWRRARRAECTVYVCISTVYAYKGRYGMEGVEGEGIQKRYLKFGPDRREKSGWEKIMWK